MPRKTAIRIVTSVFVTRAGLVFALVGSLVVDMVMITKAVDSMDPHNVETTMPDTIPSLGASFEITSIILVTGLAVATIAFLWTILTCAGWLFSRVRNDSVDDLG